MTDIHHSSLFINHYYSNPQSPIPNRSFALIVILLALAAGCEKSQDAQVVGIVTVDGVPLRLGTVTFHPASGGAVAYAQIDKNGRYCVRTGTKNGLAVGEYMVTVVATTEPKPVDRGMDVAGDLITPARYANPQRSGLRVKVERGVNHVDLPLRSK
jgi:hypothetical protein